MVVNDTLINVDDKFVLTGSPKNSVTLIAPPITNPLAGVYPTIGNNDKFFAPFTGRAIWGLAALPVHLRRTSNISTCLLSLIESGSCNLPWLYPDKWNRKKIIDPVNQMVDSLFFLKKLYG